MPPSRLQLIKITSCFRGSEERVRHMAGQVPTSQILMHLTFNGMLYWIFGLKIYISCSGCRITTVYIRTADSLSFLPKDFKIKNYPIYLHTYLLTYSMVQSPSWEANWFAASQEIPRISRNPKVHYRTHKPPPPVSILGQPIPVHIPTSHLLEIHPNIIQPSTPRSPH